MDRHLLDPVDRVGRFDAEKIEDRGGQVDDVAELSAGFGASLDAVGPGDQQRRADAAGMGVSLVALEGGVAGHRPASGIVIEDRRAAELVQVRDDLLCRVGDSVPGTGVIQGAAGAAFG